ncbi:hypothetical protein [Glutamicibacter sp. V16R2B1]|uniref:hypothetical protein n=1 Tax=Glutamicibacter sp. V16R2B1 TaxID=2036207 RepID=UPI0010FE2F2C|nr:hypothetical protein [Glutamicibacter sp. V16R2B1]MCK9901238.1 hypothetical protein [Frankia sp. Cpl3]TLK46884.1 hypothetical protein FDN03_16050 [Glutamicibacter sp. V16R2B1]
MSAHTCHAEGCTTPCPPRMLMCHPCWDLVPHDRQRAVLDAYQPGQERLRVMPSDAWLTAAFRANNAVALAKGQPLPYPAMEEAQP